MRCLTLVVALLIAQGDEKTNLNPGTFKEGKVGPISYGLPIDPELVVVRVLGPDRVLAKMPLPPLKGKAKAKSKTKGSVKREQPPPFVLRRPTKGLTDGAKFRALGDWEVIGTTKVGTRTLWLLAPVPKKD